MTPPGLPRPLTDRYRLERLLGEGGMATVFLATDLKHERFVALKMMRDSLSSSLGAERFLREIAVTAQLDHPHVVSLLDSGAVDGGLFFVMPFVEGESLRDRLTREKQLPLDVALSVTYNVLDALEYAHARGVIHRDIKPENILLSGGHARVADFGVARAFVASGIDTLTGTGIALGTPAYMSPEQGAADRDVDRRSDLYAVGCVLFEMLAGQPPFVGPTTESVVRQHMVAPPRPVTQLRPAVPAGVAAAIDRALAKAPADRFESAAAFARALATAARADSAVPTAAAPTAAANTGQSAAAPSRRRAFTLLVALLAVVAALAGIRWFRPAAAPRERPMVAVLPFRNLGGPEDDYFADGVTTEITTKLARISGIGVISRQTAMRYGSTTLSLRDIARELGVQYVLEGTIRTERLADGTGQVRVTPDLVRAEDETNVWTDGYTVRLVPGEIFAVQARIAESVADAFNVTLLKPEVEAVRRRETEDSAAYDADLLGRFQLAKGTPPSVRDAIGYFERAISLDPQYARPHANLAAAYLMLPLFPASWLPQTEAFARAESAARQALQLEPESAAAHSALGEVLSQGYWRWSEAEVQQRRALVLDPESAEAHLRLSSVLGVLGKHDEALIQAERALALEPTWPQARRRYADELAVAGRADEAIAELTETLRIEPGNPLPHVNLAEIHAARGDLDGMADELSLLPGLRDVGIALKAWAAGRGPRSTVVRLVEAIQSPNPELDEVRKCWLFANIEEHPRALDALERAVQMRAPGSAIIARFPSVSRALGDEPRFRALLTRLGLRAS